MRLFILIILLFQFAGCIGLGHKTLRSARFNYNEAINRTSHEQLLLNLVRLKYRDMPVFLEIGGIATQYTFSQNALVGGEVFFGGANDSLNSSVGIGYIEQPTITYSPLQGEKFAKQLMSSIPFETLFLLSQSGWSVERVLRCCVQQINEIPNAPTAAGPTPELAPEYEEYLRVSELIRDLQRDGSIQFGTKKVNGSRLPVLRLSKTSKQNPAVDELISLLSLRKGKREYTFTFDSIGRRKGEIFITPRSLLASMFYLSQSVEVPSDDVAKGRITSTKHKDGTSFDWSVVTKDLLRVKHSYERPERPFVAVNYRDSWYYIDDADLNSKSTLMLLGYLFSLQAGDIRALEPTLTLDLGG